MSRIAYVNGSYRPIAGASVSILDRGFQFADAVYEVWAVADGRRLDDGAHMARLRRSLAEIRLDWPMSEPALAVILSQVQRRNRVRDGIVYLQISRGAARRDHRFPDPAVAPTMVATATALSPAPRAARFAAGIAVILLPDQRWARCDIKSTALLPNVLAKQAAHEAGAYEAWLVTPDGLISEGASTTAWIVDKEGHVRTLALSANILPGVTRGAVLAAAARLGLPVVERGFTPEEALAAREAFITSAGSGVLPVTQINGAKIGSGGPGPVTQALKDAYFAGAAN